MIPFNFSLGSLSNFPWGVLGLGSIIGGGLGYLGGAVRRGRITDRRQVEQEKFDESVLNVIRVWYLTHPNLAVSTSTIQRLRSVLKLGRLTLGRVPPR
jgi:hypothetical protein